MGGSPAAISTKERLAIATAGAASARPFGRDAQWIEYHPAYRELETRRVRRSRIHAMSVSRAILGGRRTFLWWRSTPSPFCSTGRVCVGLPDHVKMAGAKLLSRFGDEDTEGRNIWDGAHRDRHEQADPGPAQFMTRRRGVSDRRKASQTTAMQG